MHKTDIGILPRDNLAVAGSHGTDPGYPSGLRTLSTAPMTAVQAYIDDIKSNPINQSMLVANASDLIRGQSAGLDVRRKTISKSSRTVQQVEREWLTRF